MNPNVTDLTPAIDKIYFLKKNIEQWKEEGKDTTQSEVVLSTYIKSLTEGLYKQEDIEKVPQEEKKNTCTIL